MKTWAEWATDWSKSAKLAGTGQPPFIATSTDLEKRAAVFLAAEAATRAEVDAACLSFIEAGAWPKLSPEAAWFARVRAMHAGEIALSLDAALRGSYAVEPAGFFADDDMAEWFLIPLWERSRGRWARRLAGADHEAQLKAPHTSN